MKFFVPCARDDAEAEHVWAGVRLHLFDLGLPTTRHRIHALSLHSDCRRMVEVGRDTPHGEPVLIILEASNVDVFYVCTPCHGVLEGEPDVLGLDEDGCAIDFERRWWGGREAMATHARAGGQRRLSAVVRHSERGCRLLQADVCATTLIEWSAGAEQQ